MFQRSFQHPARDMTILGGWLFADLLLGLMVIFMVAVPPIPRKAIIPPPPPTLVVQPNILTVPTNARCRTDISTPTCTGTVTLQETVKSIGNVDWSVSSDISTTIVFRPTSGVLSPGQSVTITISSIACQNGSFFFSGSHSVQPVAVRWHCTPEPQRLEANVVKFNLTVPNADVQGLLNDSLYDTQGAVEDIKKQIESQSQLSHRSVGFTIVYGGAPTDNDIPTAQAVATKIYAILPTLVNENYPVFQRSSYYGALYGLGNSTTSIVVDVYLFKQA